ncbi:MAG: peptide-methionine (S)-S-oxide reductase MsrA [Candidatus Omnitrophica bacterium]|nr:peptide-methionine (S)-S-oxide reductase MsrA [Candidatus Omnitrophota bacterium]
MGLACGEGAEKNTGTATKSIETATFAGGCFWCMQPPFEDLEGVTAVTAGYTGGIKDRPTYEEVCSGTTGHAEAIEVRYDPSAITYEQVLDVFWHQIDPTTPDRQFADVGRQYRTAIFYHSEEQRRLAEASRAQWERSGRFGKPIVTEIAPAATFYPAEAYHQHYAKTHPLKYRLYRIGSGRDAYLQNIWGRQTH